MIKTLGRAFGRLLPGAAIAALLLVASPPSHAQLILGGSGLPQPVINGDCLLGSGGVAIWGSCTGSGGLTGPGSSTNGYLPEWNGTTGTALSVGIPITTFLQSANNLSDLASAASARTNLGLGALATESALTAPQLPGLASGDLWLGNGSGVATAVTLPAAGALILSGGNAAPSGLAPATNGDCAVVASGAWALGSCGTGGGTPTYFVGASAGSANAYTLASPIPSSGWALTAGYTVSTTFPAANTGASTEAVAGGAALPIVAAQGNSLFALTGGEIQTGPSYLLTYSTNAATACGGSCYVLSPAGAQLVAFGANTTVTAYQWNAGDVFLATASGLTLTLPEASTVSKNIGIYLATGGNAVTLAPNAADGINGAAVNTAVSAPAHAGILITTAGADGTGAIEAPGAGVVAAGTCTNCNETIDAAGRVTAFSNGSGGSGGSFAIMGGMFPALMSNTATSYCSLNGAAIVASNAAQCETTSEATAEEIIAAPRQFGAIAGVSGSGFYVSGIPGTGASYTITLRVNGATPANGPMCTISSGQTSCSDTTHSASVAAGQTVDVMVVPTGTPSDSTFSWAIDAQ